MSEIRHPVTLSPAKGPKAGMAPFALLRVTLSLASLASIACRNHEPDAYGNFEATEVTVAAEVGGRQIDFRL